MKRLKFIIAIFFIAAMASCKKDSEINGDKGSLTEATYLTLAGTVNTQINYAARLTSSVGIRVGSVGGPAVDKVVVYVVKGASLDKTKWKKVKEIPFSEGVTLDVKATEIATALGVSVDDLAPGTSYTLYNEAVSKDGKTYSLANITTDFESQAPYNMAMRWQIVVVCPFVAPVAGNYKVVQDDWQDWNPGDIVQVTDGPGANQVNLGKVWPNPAFGAPINPIIVNVNPATGAATVPNVAFGDYGVVCSTTAGTGFVFACTGRIDLTIRIDAAGFGDQGNKRLILQKQ